MKYLTGNWTILFGGAGRENVIASMLDAGICIAEVIVPSKQSQKLADSISKITTLGLSVVSVDKVGLRKAMNPQKAQNLFSIGFPYLISKSILDRYSICLNIHPTLLPKYRGPTTGAYVLINGEKYAGSTVHYMVEGADKGGIIAQSRVEVTAFDTLRSLQRKIYETEPSLVISALCAIERGEKVVEQDERLASSYPERRLPSDSEIDPTLPLLNLINSIRACDSELFPAYFFYHGQKVCISLWRPEKPDNEFDLI